MSKIFIFKACVAKPADRFGSKITSLFFTKQAMSDPAKDHITIKLPSCHNPLCHGSDEVIDVRTPNEYAEDHIPGAINLPVLTNEERHEVGKDYAENTFFARRIGASLIANNLSSIIRNYFFDKPKSYSCLVYCWRGGQRSKSLAVVLNMIGYNVQLLSGGYKSYRRQVMSMLSELPSNFSYNVISGMTGCGKTSMLEELRQAGEQVLDFEGLANHKGSVLGTNHDNTDQPSTKMFESKLLQQFLCFDPSKAVWVESEGRVIGDLHIPNCVFEHIKSNVNNVYVVQVPFDKRVTYLLSEYKHWINNPSKLKQNLGRLSKLNLPIKRWDRLIDENKFEEFVKDILKNHYDPSYERSKKKTFTNQSNENCVKVIHLEEITDKTVYTAVENLLAMKDIEPVFK